MPFNLPFNFPFFYNNYQYRYPQNHNHNTYNTSKATDSFKFDRDTKMVKNNIMSEKEKASETFDASEAFFEIFGLKLYFDDILIICILFFLYTEKVQDQELFMCLILLLLT